MIKYKFYSIDELLENYNQNITIIDNNINNDLNVITFNSSEYIFLHIDANINFIKFIKHNINYYGGNEIRFSIEYNLIPDFSFIKNIGNNFNKIIDMCSLLNKYFRLSENKLLNRLYLFDITYLPKRNKSCFDCFNIVDKFNEYNRIKNVDIIGFSMYLM